MLLPGLHTIKRSVYSSTECNSTTMAGCQLQHAVQLARILNPKCEIPFDGWFDRSLPIVEGPLHDEARPN